MSPAPIDDRIQRVLVTGASGFIGRAVVERLRCEGLEALRLDRDSEPPYPVAFPAPVDVMADLAAADLDSVFASVDAVIHLAGTPGVQSSWADGFEAHVRNNLVATQRVCEAALRTSVRRVVVASSSSVYGEVTNPLANETDPLAPLSPYGASKAAVEHLLGAYAARGLSVAALRYFTVYGPWQRPDMAINRMFRAAVGGPAFPLRGDGRQARSFTYVHDVAAATVSAVQRHPESRVFNIGGGELVSVRQLLHRVESLTGVHVPLEQLPPAPGDPARTAANVERARRELGWAPTTQIHDGLVAQWRWHCDQLDIEARSVDSAVLS